MGKIVKNKIEYGGASSGDTNSVELTQAQYNALTTEEKNNGTVYYITDGQTDGYHHYMTTERQIGTFYGKPLYEKTLISNFNPLTAADDKTMNLGISSDWSLVNIFGIIYNKDNSSNKFYIPNSKATITSYDPTDSSNKVWCLRHEDFW